MGQLTRRDREKRAQSLALVSGGAAVAAVVLVVLALVGVMPIGPAFVAVIVAAAAGFMFRSTVRP